MSIYPVRLPVRLSEWFPPGDEHHEIMKVIVSSGYTNVGQGCLHCGKKHMHWQKAWGHHSLPWSYGDLWCNEKHYKNWLKKRRKGLTEQHKKVIKDMAFVPKSVVEVILNEKK